ALSEIYTLSLHDALPILVAGAFDIDFGDLLSHVVLFAVWGALVAGYFRGALIRSLVPASEGESGLSLGIIPVATALGLVDLLFLDRKSTRLNSSHVEISY